MFMRLFSLLHSPQSRPSQASRYGDANPESTESRLLLKADLCRDGLCTWGPSAVSIMNSEYVVVASLGLLSSRSTSQSCAQRGT